MIAARGVCLLAALTLLLCGSSAAQINMKIYSGFGGGSAAGSKANYQIRPYTGNVPVLTGAPFSAVQVAERHQVLMDGTHIDQVAHPVKYWRDSAGDTRVEMPMFSYENLATKGFPEIIAIFDAAESCEYILDPDKHIAHRFSVKELVVPKPTPGAEVNDRSVSEGRYENIHETIKHEGLGIEVVEGLIAKGMRTTMTKDAGVDGNDQPTENVVEQWVSVDLQVEVLYKTADIHSTDNIRKLTNVNRSEPDAALFHVPAGYKIVDEAAPFRIIIEKK
jgi:hypothetical protein